MDQNELSKKLQELLNLPHETEWVEFKEANNGYSFENLGKYFSALSNEANLKNKECGWLIFGVNDQHEVVGSNFRSNPAYLDSLKQEISRHLSPTITFEEIYVLNHPDGRVVFFQIPPAPKGIPVSWKELTYGRNGESLTGLNHNEYQTILNQVQHEDWSAKIISDATIDDLDILAIEKARIEYKNKNQDSEIDNWDDITFLNKAKVTINGGITNAAIILLGTPESVHFISPSIVQMSWILKDINNKELDYEHFGSPLLLNVDKVLGKIRNLKYRYFPDGTLFPTEIFKYDSEVIREALHNCIAHQDYSLSGKINIVEFPDSIIFSNLGFFIPGSIDNVITQDAPQSYYRNKYLADAMVNFNMIDTIGSGIKKMFEYQRNRFFPLPDFDLSKANEVKVSIQGKIIDQNYTNLLMDNSELELRTVILLDKVQKNIMLTKEQNQLLRKQNLVEGRFPNLFVSSKIASATGDKAQYIKNRAFDNNYYKELIIKYLKKYKSASRKEIDELIIGKLSEALNDNQKKNKVRNILQSMSKEDKTIENTGSSRKPQWVLKDN